MTADAVDDDAQPLRRNAEFKERIEPREARAELLLARAQNEQDRARRHERLPVDAAGRAGLCSLQEQEADIGDDERIHRREGA